MTTLSAGATAGLLVALMVAATSNTVPPFTQSANGTLNPGASKGFNPQPDPPRETGTTGLQR